MLNLKYRLLEKSPIVNIVILIVKNTQTFESKVLFTPSIDDIDQKLDRYELSIYKKSKRYYIKVSDCKIPCKYEIYETLDVRNDNGDIVDMDEFVFDKITDALDHARDLNSGQFALYQCPTKLIRQSAFDNQVDLDCVKD